MSAVTLEFNFTMRINLIFLFIFLFSGCASTSSDHKNLSVIVDDYFNVYAKRSDFKRLMSFYDNNAQLEDIIYGNNLKNKSEIKDFLAWDKGEFKVHSGELALTVTKQVIEKNIVVTQGFFNKFSYDGHPLGPWLFVIIQEFNAENKIIKQIDWINYTPRENFLGGKNMNDKITEKPL